MATCKKAVRLGVLRINLPPGKIVTLKPNHRVGLRGPNHLMDGAMDLWEKVDLEENGVNLQMRKKMDHPAPPGREKVQAGTRAPEDGESLPQ